MGGTIIPTLNKAGGGHRPPKLDNPHICDIIKCLARLTFIREANGKKT
jgi:hypothetical protein